MSQVIRGPFYGQLDHQEYDWLCQRLEVELVNYRQAGFQLAQNTVDFEREKALLTLSILQDGRDRKDKAVNITYAREVVKSDDTVSDLMLARDCSQVLVDSCKENINAIKKRMDFVRSCMERDWATARYMPG